MADNKGTIALVGDFGNPQGTGRASVSIPFAGSTNALGKAALDTFFTAIETAQLTGCNQSDVFVNFVNPQFADKPGTSTNVDRVLVATWREKSSTTVHRVSIPGVPASSTGISDEAAGERLNDVGKTALATAIQVCIGAAADSIVVLQGKVFQKK